MKEFNSQNNNFPGYGYSYTKSSTEKLNWNRHSWLKNGLGNKLGKTQLALPKSDHNQSYLKSGEIG